MSEYHKRFWIQSTLSCSGLWDEVDEAVYKRIEREEGFNAQIPGEPATASFQGKIYSGTTLDPYRDPDPGGHA